MNDTRKDGRLQVSLVARYREPTMLEPREGECKDLSPSGMFITTHRPSPRGALIRFECIPDQAEEAFRGTGRVVWQRAKPDARGAAGMGVRFVRLETGGREALQRLLERIEDDRRGNRVPRQASKSPPSRARIEEALTQPVPIFAAGAGAPSSAPPAAQAASSRFPELRSATLRGVGISDEVKNATSPSSDRPRGVQSSPLPPRPDETPPNVVLPSAVPESDRPDAMRSPSERAGNGVTDDSRERFDRTRRGVPPAPNAAEVTAAPATEGKSDRPAAQPTSDRPPSPGGTDDLRSHAQGADGRRYEPPPSFARTTLKEVAPWVRGLPEVPRLSDGSQNEGDDPWALNRDPTERRIPIGDDRTLPRTFRTSEPPRTSSRMLMWIVLGGGLATSIAVVRLFGSVPVGVPEEAMAPAKAEHAGAPDAPGASAPDPAARPYVLEVVSDPAGARVSAGGQSVIAPGELRFDRFTPPLLVTAELEGYPNATASVWPSHFTQNDDRYSGHLELRFEGAPKPVAKTAAAAPAPAQASTHESSHSRESSSRSASKTSKSSNDRTPSASAPPAPSEPPAPVVSVTPSPEPPARDEAHASAASEHGAQEPMAQALDCLGRGDNRCVIRALEDKASSAREMELLIETFRAVGSTPRAEREMQRYIKRYPSGQRADEYRKVLEHRAADTQ